MFISGLFVNSHNDPPEDERKENGEEDEAIAGDAFFVAERAQAFDAASGKVTDKLWI